MKSLDSGEATTPWNEVVVSIGNADPDELAAILVDSVPAASAGVEIRNHEIVFWVREKHRQSALEQAQKVTPSDVTLRNGIPEIEWRDAYKKHFRTTRLTRQLVVVPSWEQYDDFSGQPGDIVLALDPGMAFGTGLHSSTRLVLEQLQILSDEGYRPRQLLDVGTGSGLLCIAAANLWPSIVISAIDTDPIAVRTAKENALRNQVQSQLRCETTPICQILGHFDIVVANIQANVLCKLRHDIAARVAPDGYALLSGILTHQIEDVCSAYNGDTSLRVDVTRVCNQDPEWSVIQLVRKQ